MGLQWLFHTQNKLYPLPSQVPVYCDMLQVVSRIQRTANRLVFIRTISTVQFTVALPFLRDTLVVVTGELVGGASEL